MQIIFWKFSKELIGQFTYCVITQQYLLSVSNCVKWKMSISKGIGNKLFTIHDIKYHLNNYVTEHSIIENI